MPTVYYTLPPLALDAAIRLIDDLAALAALAPTVIGRVFGDQAILIVEDAQCSAYTWLICTQAGGALVAHGAVSVAAMQATAQLGVARAAELRDLVLACQAGQIFACDRCGRTFPSSRAHRMHHMRAHRTSSVRHAVAAHT